LPYTLVVITSVHLTSHIDIQSSGRWRWFIVYLASDVSR